MAQERGGDPVPLASLLRSIAQDVREATPTPTGTHECEVCEDKLWHYIETDDNAGYWARCECDASVRQQLRLAGLMEDDKIPPGIATYDPDRQTSPERREAAHAALAGAKRWITGETRDLILCGPIGVGKTHLAKAAVANQVLNGRGALFVRAGAFYRQMMDFDRSRESRMKYVDQLSKVPSLAFDDLGAAQTGNDEILGRLEDLTDRRYEIQENQTLVTTNMIPDELERAIGVRSYDRLTAGAEIINMPGVSQR
jgi:DNA replication protein DnaC